MRTRTARARGLRLVSAAAAVPLVLAACGSDDGGSAGGSDPVRISFLTHWGPEQVAMLEEAATEFESEHDGAIEVEIRAVPFANLLSTLRTQGSSANGPTMASVYDLWLAELVRDELAAAAPDDIANAVTDAWPDNLVAGVTKDDAVRGFPNEVNLYALNYNTALFDEAGIEAAPTTWAELSDAADAISALGDGRQGFGVISSWPAGTVHPWLSMVASNGGALLDAATPTLDTPEVAAVAELYAELVDSGATVPTMSGANANTTGPYLDNFVNEKTGMIIMANWWKGALQEAMGDRFDDVAVAPIPVGPDGTSASSVSYSWLTIVNGNARDEQQEAAWDFLTWLNGDTSGADGSSAMGDILMSMGILPSRTSDLEAHADQLAEPFLAAYVDLLPDATPFPSVLGGEEMTVALQQQLEQLLFGSVDPATAMDNAQSEVSSILSAKE
ncbi:extracellular solute-binding protein [Phytoactinopolyspora limicola]|uniref:extracellular solute-binding protein n=1 Tax=Phytoactinopolyspora limicola TaxID=2715536 RepID=UPI00140DC686|nr:extracellular solute-binding protein [Phytoactinopolyspora limicola]